MQLDKIQKRPEQYLLLTQVFERKRGATLKGHKSTTYFQFSVIFSGCFANFSLQNFVHLIAFRSRTELRPYIYKASLNYTKQICSTVSILHVLGKKPSSSWSLTLPFRHLEDVQKNALE